MTRSFALGGLAILLLVGAATTAIIVSATRSALASNREIVEVLHFVGATDRYIAREFERHFLRLGIRAGLVGRRVRHGRVSSACRPSCRCWAAAHDTAEMHRLIGTGGLDIRGYLLLGGVVVIISALCMLTSPIWRVPHPQCQAVALRKCGKATGGGSLPLQRICRKRDQIG